MKRVEYYQKRYPTALDRKRALEEANDYFNEIHFKRCCINPQRDPSGYHNLYEWESEIGWDIMEIKFLQQQCYANEQLI